MPKSAGTRFGVLLTFHTERADQATHLEALRAFIAERMAALPGFRSAHLFTSEDGQLIVEYQAWDDRESYEHYRQSETGREAAAWLMQLSPKAEYLRLGAQVFRK